MGCGRVGASGSFGYQDIEDNYLPTYTRSWDKEAQVPWLYDADAGVMISYDDPTSLAAKAAYVLANSLGGVMIWPLSADDAQRLPVLPYLFACTFIADTASFLLPVSNPINIIILSRFPLDLLTFLRLLFLPSLVVIAINIGIFFLLYRKQLRGVFEIKRLPSAEQAVKHKAYFRYTCCVLAVVAFAYVITSATQFPLSLIALSGAVLLLIGGLCWRRTSLRETTKRISWSIFGFIAGMFIVVRAIEDTGLTTAFGNWLIHLSGGTSFGAVMVGTLGSALGTSSFLFWSL